MNDREWNLQKIRSAALELLGWIRVEVDDIPDDEWEYNIKDRCGEVWKRLVGDKTEYRHEIQVASCDDGEMLPNPTRSMDDAVPLAFKYEMTLSMYGDGTCSIASVHALSYRKDFRHPALEICLHALLCAGRDLKEFEL